MELDRPFLKLPFIFDTAVLAGEVERVLPEQWLPHPGFTGQFSRATGGYQW